MSHLTGVQPGNAWGSEELLENRQLLWHGSGTGNWGSILKTGLRIAPPEAPTTGWLFGKGIYLANAIGKSGAYCQVDPDEDDVGACDPETTRVIDCVSPCARAIVRCCLQGPRRCWRSRWDRPCR
jgi:hypothetical protein